MYLMVLAVPRAVSRRSHRPSVELSQPCVWVRQGCRLGNAVGDSDGVADGKRVHAGVVGDLDGAIDGTEEGVLVWTLVGLAVGDDVGWDTVGGIVFHSQLWPSVEQLPSEQW